MYFLIKCEKETVLDVYLKQQHTMLYLVLLRNSSSDSFETLPENWLLEEKRCLNNN